MQSDIPRRTLEEVIARYQLEPELTDVFVEGWFDARVLTWFVNEVGASSVAVYEIDSVECGAGALAQIGLTDNSRNRVIRLALGLATEFGQGFSSAVCIADSDHEVLATTKIQCGPLWYTDLSSLEMYFFSTCLLEKALITAVGVQCDVSAVLAEMTAVLQRLFVLRCANIKLGWGMAWYAPWKCLNYEDGKLVFDEVSFTERYLNKNSRGAQRNEFEQVMKSVEQGFADGIVIRGHDAFDLLGWWLKQVGAKQQFCEHDVLLSLAVAAVSVEYLLGLSLFQKLRDWMLAVA